MRMLKLMTLTMLLLIPATAQTTYVYTVPSGTSCTTTINGCTLHNLTTPTVEPFPGGATAYGYWVGGTYWSQFAFQIFEGQNAAGGATYCAGNGAYTQTPRPDLGTNAVEWKLDCVSNQWTNGSGPGELGVVGPYHIVVDLITHWQIVTKVVYRWRENFTIWTIDSGTVNLTPVTQ